MMIVIMRRAMLMVMIVICFNEDKNNDKHRYQ